MSHDAAAAGPAITYTFGNTDDPGRNTDSNGRRRTRSFFEWNGEPYDFRRTLASKKTGLVRIFTSTHSKTSFVVKCAGLLLGNHLKQTKHDKCAEQKRQDAIESDAFHSQKELDLMRITHPSLQTALKISPDVDRAFRCRLILPLLGEDLKNYLRQVRRDPLFPSSDLYHLLHMTVSELKRIHDLGIAHRDFKAENTLVPDNWRENGVVIIDGSHHTRVGEALPEIAVRVTLNGRYHAPEFKGHNKLPAQLSEDIYCVGYLLQEVRDNLRHGVYSTADPLFTITPELSTFIDQAMSENPADRPESLDDCCRLLHEHYCMAQALERLDFTDGEARRWLGKPALRSAVMAIQRRRNLVVQWELLETLAHNERLCDLAVKVCEADSPLVQDQDAINQFIASSTTTHQTLDIIYRTHFDVIPDGLHVAIDGIAQQQRIGTAITISADRPDQTRFINLRRALQSVLRKIIALEQAAPGDNKIAFLKAFYVRVLLAAQADFSPATCRAALDVRTEYQEAITRHRNDPDVRVINLGIFQIKRGRTATDKTAKAAEDLIYKILQATQ